MILIFIFHIWKIKKKNCLDCYAIRANCYLKLKKNDEAMKNLDEFCLTTFNNYL